MNETSIAVDTSGTAKIIYILYLVGIVTGGLTTLIGLVMAYIYQGTASDSLRTHYRFLIRTFWILILYSATSIILYLIGLLLAVVLIGYAIIFLALIFNIFILIWLIIRCVKGMRALDMKQPHPNPATWMFS